MKKELQDYLFSFIKENNWDYENVPEQSRALFTTLCFIGNIDADASECEKLLSDLFFQSSFSKQIAYGEFALFMRKFIL